MGLVAAKIMGYEGVWLTRGMGYEVRMARLPFSDRLNGLLGMITPM